MAVPDLETVRKAINDKLLKYVGAPLTPFNCGMMRNELEQILWALRDSSFWQLTAAEFRQMGKPVPENVPDCATAEFEWGELHPSDLDPSIVKIPLRQISGWKWLEFEFTV